MDDISAMTVSELENRKRLLDLWIDKIAMELDGVNTELARRLSQFRALCTSSGVTLEAPRPPRGARYRRRSIPQ